MTPPPAFELPDTMTALPPRPFEFSAAAVAEADAALAQPTADQIAARVAQVKADLAVTIGSLASLDADTRDLVLRQRAPLGLLGGCWLDVLSQPATQPSIVVNKLFAHHYELRGAGNARRSLHYLRKRALEEAGVYL